MSSNNKNLQVECDWLLSHCLLLNISHSKNLHWLHVLTLTAFLGLCHCCSASVQLWTGGHNLHFKLWIMRCLKQQSYYVITQSSASNAWAVICRHFNRLWVLKHYLYKADEEKFLQTYTLILVSNFIGGPNRYHRFKSSQDTGWSSSMKN